MPGPWEKKLAGTNGPCPGDMNFTQREADGSMNTFYYPILCPNLFGVYDQQAFACNHKANLSAADGARSIIDCY